MKCQSRRTLFAFFRIACEKHRLMMVVAKDMEERTSAPRVNERKQTGTQNFNTRDYKRHSQFVDGCRSKLTCLVKEIRWMVQLVGYTDCDLVMPSSRLVNCVYLHTYLLIYLLCLLTYLPTYFGYAVAQLVEALCH
jgi:hypothetical protein